MKETKTRKYRSDVHNSTLMIIGTTHGLDSTKVYDILEQFGPDVVCYEMGVAKDGFDPSNSEHKAIKQYTEDNQIPKEGVDVDNLREVAKRPYFSDEEKENMTESERFEKIEESKDKEKGLDMRSFKSKAVEYEDDDWEGLDDVSLEDIEKRNAMVSGDYPHESMFFMKLRNQRMAMNLDKQLQKYQRVALVVGIAHLPGILRHLEWCGE